MANIELSEGVADDADLFGAIKYEPDQERRSSVDKVWLDMDR